MRNNKEVKERNHHKHLTWFEECPRPQGVNQKYFIQYE